MTADRDAGSLSGEIEGYRPLRDKNYRILFYPPRPEEDNDDRNSIIRSTRKICVRNKISATEAKLTSTLSYLLHRDRDFLICFPKTLRLPQFI